MMDKEALSYCPICSNKLIATTLKCKNCDLQLSGDFTLSKFSYLSGDDLDFVEAFLIAEGSYKSLQEDFGITFSRVKQRMADILQKLGLNERSTYIDTTPGSDTPLHHSTVNIDDHFIVKLIKGKLNACGGIVIIPLISAGKEAKIEFDADGSGLVCDKIPVPKQLIWEVFIAAYNILIMQDGELYKGYARTGKLGSERLPVDSLEGFIAYAVHGVKKGESAFSPGFVIAAVLDWVGLLKNERGSVLKMVDEFAYVKTYEEVLENAITFNEVLESSDIIRSRLSRFRHWYYFAEKDIFAPSKFIGYKSMKASTYEAFALGNRDELDGRVSCRTLDSFFDEAMGEVKDDLCIKLKVFLSKYGSEPCVRCFIHMKK